MFSRFVIHGEKAFICSFAILWISWWCMCFWAWAKGCVFWCVAKALGHSKKSSRSNMRANIRTFAHSRIQNGRPSDPLCGSHFFSKYAKLDIFISETFSFFYSPLLTVIRWPISHNDRHISQFSSLWKRNETKGERWDIAARYRMCKKLI